MNCKNCHSGLSEAAKFCPNCGAKIVKERITVKHLFSIFFTNVFGWDNKYFFTIKSLIRRPEVILKEYIDGTRKKYVNPLAFFAIGAALALLVFNLFAEDYIKLTQQFNNQQIELMSEIVIEPTEGDSTASAEQLMEEKKLKYKKDQIEMSTKIQKFILKYFNLFSFVFLPIYGFMAFLVFRKPYNYGEHLVISAYLQGFLFLSTLTFFMIGVFINPSLYIVSLLFNMFFYSYAYGRLYEFSFGKSVLKLLKFIGVLLGIFILLMIVLFAIGVIVAYIAKGLGRM